MPRELVSRKARLELREYFVGTTLSVISNEFESADIESIPIDLPNISGQRRRLVEAHYASIDWSQWADVPSLAIGTAKELVETICKTVLEQRQVAVADDLDLGQLVNEARKALGLIPESIPNAARGADSIRRLLSNLGNVAQGLSELRNMYGTGHGEHGATAGLAPRHARLAVGAAATLATFILETHEERGL